MVILQSKLLCRKSRNKETTHLGFWGVGILPFSRTLHCFSQNICTSTTYLQLIRHPPVCPTRALKCFVLRSVHQLNFLSSSHTLLHKNYKCLWAYWGIQVDRYLTYILSLLLEDKCFIYRSFSFLFFLEGIFKGIFHLHQGFCCAVNHKWHLPSHPHSATKCRLLFWLPVSNCCQKTSEQACPLLHHCQPMLPPSLQGLHVVTAHKENVVLHLAFQSISPTCHFNVFFSYQILVKFISICFPRLFYVACLLHALRLPPLFTADFFTLLTHSGCVSAAFIKTWPLHFFPSFICSQQKDKRCTSRTLTPLITKPLRKSGSIITTPQCALWVESLSTDKMWSVENVCAWTHMQTHTHAILISVDSSQSSQQASKYLQNPLKKIPTNVEGCCPSSAAPFTSLRGKVHDSIPACGSHLRFTLTIIRGSWLCLTLLTS